MIWCGGHLLAFFVIGVCVSSKSIRFLEELEGTLLTSSPRRFVMKRPQEIFPIWSPRPTTAGIDSFISVCDRVTTSPFSTLCASPCEYPSHCCLMGHEMVTKRQGVYPLGNSPQHQVGERSCTCDQCNNTTSSAQIQITHTQKRINLQLTESIYIEAGVNGRKCVYS